LYTFGARSEANLENVHPELVRLCRRAIEHIDFSVIDGFRTQSEQMQLYADRKSQLNGTTQQSMHQLLPSQAVDLLPYPGNMHGRNIWQDKQRFCLFAGQIIGMANALGLTLRWGGDWNSDGSLVDTNFVDMAHFELILRA